MLCNVLLLPIPWFNHFDKSFVINHIWDSVSLSSKKKRVFMGGVQRVGSYSIKTWKIQWNLASLGAVSVNSGMTVHVWFFFLAKLVMSQHLEDGGYKNNNWWTLGEHVNMLLTAINSKHHTVWSLTKLLARVSLPLLINKYIDFYTELIWIIKWNRK